MKALILTLLTSTAFAGTTYFASPTGGAYNAGAVYQVNGSERTVIYDFCPGNCFDGSMPLTDVIAMPDGSLVGATSKGGSGVGEPPEGAGVIFRLTPNGDGTWAEEVLFNFCPWWNDCGHYGMPMGHIWLVTPTTVEGVIQTPDGSKGLRWRFKLADQDGASVWKPIQHWTK